MGTCVLLIMMSDYVHYGFIKFYYDHYVRSLIYDQMGRLLDLGIFHILSTHMSSSPTRMCHILATFINTQMVRKTLPVC